MPLDNNRAQINRHKFLAARLFTQEQLNGRLKNVKNNQRLHDMARNIQLFLIQPDAILCDTLPYTECFHLNLAQM
jgi:hypothetical protein